MSLEENTEVYGSCSVTYRNKYYVFGGKVKMRQISEVAECKLRRIGSLDFDHSWAACSNVDNQKLYLCFDELDSKRCRSADDPLGKFSEIVSSSYNHKKTKTAASPSKLSVASMWDGLGESEKTVCNI